jgi:drug/metabolite transporter (DMT)-like permease
MSSTDNNIRLSRISRNPSASHSRTTTPTAANSSDRPGHDTERKPGADKRNGLNQHPPRSSRRDTSSDLGLDGPDDFEIDDEDDIEEEGNAMGDTTRTPFLQPSRSGTPLLGNSAKANGMTGSDDDDDYEDRGRLQHGHARSTPAAMMRSRSPGAGAEKAARKKYLFAAVFLVITLVSFSVQTELAAYVQHDLGWSKAYCMLYLTHGSWAMLWPVQLLILRVQNWSTPWPVFWRRHLRLLHSTAQMVAHQDHHVPRHATSPIPYILRTTAFVTSALTVAGLSWYLAVNMTSPSDLTAIYNCSAFFAYGFSVPLLKEPLRLDKSLAVLLAIAGVLVVAYGDSSDPESDVATDADAHINHAGTRLLGNLIIGAGSVLYGLYEVLYKRWACPPEGVSPQRGTIFANAFGSCIGLFTLTVLWVPLPILHILGWETFELPTGETAFWLWLSVVMNATFAGSFLVLISLTSPVLSSVASLLTIFIVAVADWLLKGEELSAAALSGGLMIVIAFIALSWSTWREMREEEKEGRGSEVAHAPLPDDDWSDDDRDEFSLTDDEEVGKGAGR